MKDEYYNKVLVYQKQELPLKYKDSIRLVNDTFIVSIPETVTFDIGYKEVNESINSSINRIRNREFDLKFSVKSKFQERDFTILR